ncbi:glycosyl hydrolase family 18 protein [Undibacterium flavidum]|uniref:GH18 domain-containing protein n=1 Tax=Undibacterium flavidum TaxID=2762297 RepID=A0ABR6Y9F2_9BURK|nr:glycosyl hydrolase family 18 protein [Undibacterium flavidum]MBC3873251.1 hypothetical protein [Undibacterium flavidum]
MNWHACAQSQQTQVIAWIPAYGVEKSMQALQENPHIALGLTRIGLQFWNPAADGKSVVFAPVDESGRSVDPAKLLQIISWAKQRKIQVLLTVYNNSQVMKKWDWDLARRAFRDHPQEFAASLIKTMHQFELDGIDLDLEGEGELDTDRADYAKFVKALSKQLRKQKKLLTIDSFHSPCINAPNMRWWRDWTGHIDAIHSMGYQDLYEGNSNSFTPDGKVACEGGAPIFKYSWQLAYAKKAGYRTDQIVLGMPTWLAQWGEAGLGSSISAHLQEAKNLGVGIALWDLQLAAKEWRSVQTWNEVQQIQQLRAGVKTSPR